MKWVLTRFPWICSPFLIQPFQLPPNIAVPATGPRWWQIWCARRSHFFKSSWWRRERKGAIQPNCWRSCVPSSAPMGPRHWPRGGSKRCQCVWTLIPSSPLLSAFIVLTFFPLLHTYPLSHVLSPLFPSFLFSSFSFSFSAYWQWILPVVLKCYHASESSEEPVKIQMADDLVSFCWECRICMFNKFLGNAATTTGATLWEPLNHLLEQWFPTVADYKYTCIALKLPHAKALVTKLWFSKCRVGPSWYLFILLKFTDVVKT